MRALLIAALIAVTPTAYAATALDEAEAAQLSGGARWETEHPGYTGTGYVGGFTDGNRGTATATFAITSPSAADTTATLRYANGTGSTRTMSLIVNGVTRQFSLPPVGGWDAWGTVTQPLSLNAGANTVAVKYGTGDNGNINLDNLTVAQAPAPGPAGGELESAFLAGGATVGSDVAGFTGSGFVTNLNGGARVVRTVARTAAGTATTTLRFRNATGSARTLSVYANGLKQGQISLPAGDGWRTAQRDLPLRVGLNLLGYQVDAGDSGGVQLDNVAVAGSTPLAARGATVPYTTFEAEAGQTNGSVLAAGRTYTTEQAEASGRRAVRLTGTGQYVQVTLTKPANALTVRASIPDGSTTPLAVYANGTKVTDLALTSRYSWMYGAYPFTDGPGGANPHRFFDDARVLLPRTYPAGTVLKVQKDSTASAYVTVDLLETEEADAAYPAPGGYVSVTAYGATPNDNSDDTNAFRTAVSQGRGVYIPAGTFVLSGTVSVAGIDVRGAGIWRTVLSGLNRRGGFLVTGSNTTLGDFTLDGDVTTRDPDCCPGSDAAIEGDFGTGSLIHHVATNHAKVGLWVTGNTDGLYAAGLRIRNTMADGVNFTGNTRNSRLEQTTVRNTGDDCLAMWSWSATGTVRNTVFAFVSAALPILANTAGIYGGTDNRIEDSLFTDVVFQGSGVTVSSWHSANPFGGTTVVRRSTLTRTGSHSLDWGSDIGALWVYAEANDIAGAVLFQDLEVTDSSYQGLLLSWQKRVNNLTLDHVAFAGTGTLGMEFNSPGTGSFSYVTVSRTGGAALANNAGFTINRGPGNSGF
ncbi:glycosyl hydrolase family 28-related protein [Pseudosporangium ferrugineum]|uniref:Carbohydrate binding protein with CBM6 domain n=1 Tax=Pseudosporangium ferrugineum TaxID=439699 RepID=A0A2T0S7E9_9ACTN|nr:glycosyl hydrolase family 28-related protein [Pseudosporangium ferrugineum]PRY29340.1 carbohydrate binding protein with CBM6 domain [Pseudosporangium ferrugineum]